MPNFVGVERREDDRRGIDARTAIERLRPARVTAEAPRSPRPGEVAPGRDRRPAPRQRRCSNWRSGSTNGSSGGTSADSSMSRTRDPPRSSSSGPSLDVDATTPSHHARTRRGAPARPRRPVAAGASTALTAAEAEEERQRPRPGSGSRVGRRRRPRPWPRGRSPGRSTRRCSCPSPVCSAPSRRSIWAGHGRCRMARHRPSLRPHARACRDLRLRRGHPDQPVRRLLPLRGRPRPAHRPAPAAERHRSRHQRLGPARAQRGRPGRLRRTLRGRGRGRRASGRRAGGAGAARRAAPAADGRSPPPLPRPPEDRPAHQQLRAATSPPTARPGRTRWPRSSPTST